MPNLSNLKFNNYCDGAKLQHHMGCQLALQSILDNSKNFRNDFSTWRELKNTPFQEVFVSHIPNMTSGSSVAQARFINVGIPGTGGDLMLMTG